MGPRGVVALLSFASMMVGVGLGVVGDRLLMTETPAAVVSVEPSPHRDPNLPNGPNGPNGPRDPQHGGRKGDPRHVRRDPDGRELARLVDKLKLDPTQADKVKTILLSRRPALAEAMKEIRPKLVAIHDEAQAQIRAVLTPEQAVRYDDLRREWEQQREQQRQGRDGTAPIGSSSVPGSDHDNTGGSRDVQPDGSGSRK